MKQVKTIILLNALSFLMIFVSPILSFANYEAKGEIPITCNSNDALQSFLNGREAFEMNRMDVALNHFNEAIIKEPSFALAYLYKAYSSDNIDEKQINIDQALRFRNKTSEGERILLEMESVAPGNNEGKRLQLATQLVKLYPNSARALLIMAGEYQAMNDITKFRDLVRDAVQTEPNSPLGYRALAASYVLDKPMDLVLAEKYMKKFVELRPNEALAHLALGDVYRAQTRIFDAKEAYSKAIEINPKADVAYAKRGYMNSFFGTFKEAESDFQTARDLKSKKSIQNNYLQSFLFPDSENSTFQKMNDLAYDPKSPQDEHYFCCSIIAMSKGLYAPPDESLDESDCLEQALLKEAVAPDVSKMLSNFAFLASIRAIQDGNFELATQKIDEFDHLTMGAKDPQSSPVYNYLTGLNHLKQKQYARAINHYQKSDLTNACVKFELGLAYDGVGNHEKARELFQQVTQCNFPSTKTPVMVKMAQKWINTPVAINTEQ
jgi:tetratricopeptide (TPR) repeat protein